MTILFTTFTLIFILSHTVPNTLTSLNNFSSGSANSVVSSENSRWLISNLPPIRPQQLQPIPEPEWLHSNVPKLLGSIPLTTLMICSPQLYVQVAIKGFSPVKGGDNYQSIVSTVSDAIVRSWLWSTATGNCPLGYFSIITASSW